MKIFRPKSKSPARGGALLGVTADRRYRCPVAWLAAWPLTQLGLLVQPALAHYGGLSGVVHAGVAIVTLHVIVVGYRWIGAAVLVMLFVKLATESPFGPPLRQVAGWDIALAPLAHATGVAAGLLCGALAETAAHFARRRAARRAG